MGSSCKNVQELREAIESLAVMAGGKDTEQTTPAAEFWILYFMGPYYHL